MITMASTRSNSLNIPTIKIRKHHSIFEDEQITTLRETCELIGFFFLEVEDSDLKELLDRVFTQSKIFFSLPTSVKKQCSDPIMNRGYTSMGEEILDPSNQVRGDTKEGYYLAEDISKNDPRYNPLKLSGPNVYPINIQGTGGLDSLKWKQTMMDYHEQMRVVCFQLTQMLALALDLPKTYFDPHFREPMAFLRLLHYSNEVSNIDDGIFACGAHSDYGMLTVLAVDSPGLQIFHNEQWLDVPMFPNDDKSPSSSCKFVVNLGDMLERWTNGKFKSTLHRVVISPDKSMRNESSKPDRYSIPFFYEPAFDTVVECISSCVGDEGPKYPPTTSGQHLLDKYKETHAEFTQLE